MHINKSRIKYSVIIPYFKKKKYFIRCLDSLYDQEFKNFEIIVVDDASCDDVSIIIDVYKQKFSFLNIPFKFITLSENYGPSYARNMGIKESIGAYLAFLDADDYWHKQKLRILNKYIDEFKPNLIANESSTSIKGTDNIYTYSDFAVVKYFRFKIFFKNIATTPSIIIKKGIKYNFDESMRYSEDYDLWLRIILFYENIYIIKGPQLTFLGRPVLSIGGASSSKFKMRLGELYSYSKLINSRYILLVPLLILFSIFKHFFMLVRNNKN